MYSIDKHPFSVGWEVGVFFHWKEFRRGSVFPVHTLFPESHCQSQTRSSCTAQTSPGLTGFRANSSTRWAAWAEHLEIKGNVIKVGK